MASVLAGSRRCANVDRCVAIEHLTLYMTNSIFIMMHFDAFGCTKSNKFASLVHFLYFVWDAKRNMESELK